MNNGSQGPATKETPLDFPCKCVCHKVGLEGFQCCPCTIKLQAGLPCAKCGRSLQGHYCYFNSPENSTFSFKTAEPQTCQAPARPASSQGPAREETLKALQHDYEQGAFWPFTSWNATCKALSKAFDAGAKSVVAAPQLEVFDIPFCNSPCGHSSQYAHTSDGGKTIICLICEVERLTAGAAALPSEWISPHKSLPDEDDVVLVAVVCESDDHDGGTQRWEEVHEATMYRAGGNIVAACYADNAEYMDDEILGWRELPSPPVPSKEPK